MIRWAAVFLMWLVVEWAYARLTVHIVNMNAPMAGFFCAIVVGFMGLTTLGYVQDPWLIIPMVLGASTGTYLTVRYAP